MICSLFFASWLCFQPVPIACPKIYEEKIIYNETATFTAYTLSEDETDSSPTIGAWGDDLSKYGEECIVATRLYPRDTSISIEGIQRPCRVLDRTGEKYANRIDILMPTKKEAFAFGIQTKKYKVNKIWKDKN